MFSQRMDTVGCGVGLPVAGSVWPKATRGSIIKLMPAWRARLRIASSNGVSSMTMSGMMAEPEGCSAAGALVVAGAAVVAVTALVAEAAVAGAGSVVEACATWVALVAAGAASAGVGAI